MLATIGGIVVLLILSGFFSGSETALTAASRPLMHQLERRGSARAAVVNRLHAHKDRLIGAILLGNNLVNILASALATSLLISVFGEAGVVYATIGMTLLVLIFSEVLPKTYAFEHADRVSLTVAPLVRVVVIVFSPVTRTIQVVIDALLKLLGSHPEGTEALATNSEELRGAIELHEGEGAAVRHERAMLRSVLDLNEVQVGEVMTHRKNLSALDAGAAPAEIVDAVLASPFTRIPLWLDDPDNIVGVIHAKALLRAVRARGGDMEGLDITALASKPWFIPESTTLLDQLQAFRKRREHFALVVDEYGALLGNITLEDILEEIVGDISDEHDLTVVGVRRQPDGSYVVDGTVTLRDLNRQFEWDLPDDEASTIAGLVLYEAQRIPDVGQVFRFHGFVFEILRRQRNQITAIRVTPPPPEDVP